MSKTKFKIQNLSIRQQVALRVILNLNKRRFRTSEVADSDLWTDEGKRSIGGIVSALGKNNIIKRLSGGQDKLWELDENIDNNRKLYENELNPVIAYWANR